MHAYAIAPAGARTEAGTDRRFSRRILAAAAASLIAAASLLGTAAPALAHDQLVGIEGAVSPDQRSVALTLQFNNEVMNGTAEFIATGADGSDLLDGPAETSGRNVTQSVLVPALDETITVMWRVVSSDGHPISEPLSFAVVEHDGVAEVEFRETPETDGAAGGEDAAAGEDSSAEESTADAPSDSADNGGSGVSTGVWVAIAVALVAAVGGGIAMTKRKQFPGSAAGSDESGEQK